MSCETWVRHTTYSISGVALEKIESIKDLGLTFDSKLIFDEHINNKINKARQMLGIVKINLFNTRIMLWSYIMQWCAHTYNMHLIINL